MDGRNLGKREVVKLLRREFSPESYRLIQRLWIAHSIAEHNRDIPGLIDTLTEDCLYELANTGDQWRGHEGARQFYTELLNAFPDVDFDLQHIVVGPQGVYEEAHVTGTHLEDWRAFKATGKSVEFNVSILFPWDPQAEKFSGERMYVFGFPQT